MRGEDFKLAFDVSELEDGRGNESLWVKANRRETHVIVTVEVDVAREVFCGCGGIRRVDERSWRSEILSRRRDLILVESSTRRAELREEMRRFEFLLWMPDARRRGYSNAAVCAAMTRVIPTLDPSLVGKIVDVDVIQPDIIKVLASNDEQPVGSDGREVGVAGTRDEGFRS
jgi:hypothetical protein